jgi:hypothetical protein
MLRRAAAICEEVFARPFAKVCFAALLARATVPTLFLVERDAGGTFPLALREAPETAYLGILAILVSPID